MSKPFRHLTVVTVHCLKIHVLFKARKMSDESRRNFYALKSRFCFVVSDVRDEHAIERALAHADDVLTTEAAAAVLERQQEAALVTELGTAVAVGGR